MQPCAYGAHNVSRKNMAEIADDYFDDQIDGQHKVDVLLGGGSELFARKDRDLVKEFSQAGYGHVTDKKSLNENQDDKILGLFAPGGLPKMIDRTEEVPSLADMTEAALQRLDKNEKGFFLMVEGSQIDWAGHSNDIVGAMSEMQDFEAAFEKAIDFAKKMVKHWWLQLQIIQQGLVFRQRGSIQLVDGAFTCGKTHA